MKKNKLQVSHPTLCWPRRRRRRYEHGSNRGSTAAAAAAAATTTATTNIEFNRSGRIGRIKRYEVAVQMLSILRTPSPSSNNFNPYGWGGDPWHISAAWRYGVGLPQPPVFLLGASPLQGYVWFYAAAATKVRSCLFHLCVLTGWSQGSQLYINYLDFMAFFLHHGSLTTSKSSFAWSFCYFLLLLLIFVKPPFTPNFISQLHDMKLFK